ncbi:MAG TPA: hypothetical protein VNN77_18120 [candidate division Zixibacteria bacterium]|nr:hypothetical protein [candidate division Zixibacteria bacterium]
MRSAAGPRALRENRNRRMGFILGASIAVYIAAVIAFIVAY